MRITATLFVAATLLIAAPAMAQKVYVDFDKTADFESYTTFAWAKTDEVSVKDSNPLMDSRIKNAIEYQLVDVAGLIEVDEDPDIWVTYFGEDQTKTTFHTSSYGMGYGPGWGWDPFWDGGMTTATTTQHDYTEGTLVIDIWDAKEKRVVWRGSATAVLKSSPQKQTRQIDKAVKKIVAKWEKEYRRSQR